jgi:rfaE bifunctional protein nucleotidyltransferase chain/domain
MSSGAGGSLVVIGDALLDRDIHGRVDRLVPDAPVPVLDQTIACSRPGGAGLAAALAAADARPVTLVTALAGDEAGAQLRGELERRGVEIVDLGLGGPTPEKVRFLAGGQLLMRLDRGGAAPVGEASAAARAAIGWAEAVLVSDYGGGVAAEPGLRDLLAGLEGRVPVVWDPHPRGPAPVPGLAVVTPNEGEAMGFAREVAGAGGTGAAECAEVLRRRWGAEAVCVTLAQYGALLVCEGSPPAAIPAPPAHGGDACGAGDRFASRLAGALADGWGLADAALAAVTVASAFVAAGGAGRVVLEAPADAGTGATDAMRLAERVRAGAGTVVATGGCFDLLHAGHIRMLEAARGLGDCLIVLLNSDASVRELKGPGRPLVPQADRAAVLAALGCVDAVMVFDEATPERALRRLHPDVWAKGGDYQGSRLPEERALREWGGRVVLLPYIEGHSTTRLIEEAATRV